LGPPQGFGKVMCYHSWTAGAPGGKPNA
jgi:hypothetical protein